MELEHLRTFVHVAREGSFSKAARALDVSQPLISARIAALEREMGGRLFARGGRALALTDRGATFLPYVDRALATLHEGVETARQTGAGQRGRVTVGTVQPLCGDYLARAVERFQADHPRVDVFVRVGHSEQVIEMVRDRAVRVGLVGGWFPATSLVEVVCRVRQPLVLIVPADSPLALRSAVRLADIGQAAPPLYLVEWARGLRTIVADALHPAHPMVEIPFEMAQRFVAGGRGATFATRAMVAADVAAGRLHAVPVVDLPPLYYENAIVRLKGATLPPSVTAFIDVVQAEAEAMQDNLDQESLSLAPAIDSAGVPYVFSWAGGRAGGRGGRVRPARARSPVR